MQGYTDYLSIISLPYSLVKEVSRYKRMAVNTIGHFEGMHSTANIIISHQTHCKPFVVEAAIEKMKARLATVPPVELQIIGFDFFNDGPYGKSIYAVIEINIQTENWFRLLLNQMEIRKLHFVPMVVIAKKLDADQFKTLWPLFAGQKFMSSFIVNTLTVLQRETFAEFAHWMVYRELFFGTRLPAF